MAIRKSEPTWRRTSLFTATLGISILLSGQVGHALTLALPTIRTSPRDTICKLLAVGPMTQPTMAMRSITGLSQF